MRRDGRTHPALAEIDRISAANRMRRSTRVDAELVELRHQAFSELARSTGPDVWPPELPDPFPGTSGPPEVSATELSPARLGGALTHHGCLIVREFVRPDAVSTLVDDIDRSLEAFDDWAAKGSDRNDSPYFVPFEPSTPTETNVAGLRKFIRANGGVWTADAPPVLFELMSLFEAVGLRDVVEGYFSEPAAMSMNKCTLRRVPVDAHPEWHQDGAFLGSGIRSVNVWIALSQCGGMANRPGLDIVARRLDELVPTATDGAYFETSVGHGMVERVAGEGNIQRPEFEPGDALLFDELLLHRTGTSPGMTEERYAIETWLFAASRYPAHHVPLAL